MKTMNSRFFCRCLVVLGCLSCLSLGRGQSFVVTHTGDSGTGSFRQALLDADTQTGADTIRFNIPTTDGGYDPNLHAWTIQPESELPELDHGLTFIDGASQSAFIGGDPNPLGPEIVLDGSAYGLSTGIAFESAGNHLFHLVIHGFGHEQVLVRGDSNLVAGCYIGTDATGEAAAGESWNGIVLYYGQHNVVGGETAAQRNVISGNRYNGIVIGISGSYNQVLGNDIGVTASRGGVLGNEEGIYIHSSAHHNEIGPGNLVCGNLYTGIYLNSADVHHTVIHGNRIGTGTLGSESWGNGEHGIRVEQAYFTTIGGADSSFGNVISANGRAGILLTGEADSSEISWNRIGVTADGLIPLGNGWSGIQIGQNSYDNRVGPKNVIAYNGQYGVEVQSEGAMGNRITQNSIHHNAWNGILVSGGGNGDIEAPVITRLGSVIGTAPANSLVEIFSSSDDQGEHYEGSVPADDNGDFTWPGTPVGPFVTATATDGAGNTSAFSEAVHLGRLVVTTTADTGEGSLRDALAFAESNAGADTIAFHIPETDPGYDATLHVWVIRPETALPILQNGGTVIDGASQAAFVGGDPNPLGPEIVISGERLPQSEFGLDLQGDDNAVLGLTINAFVPQIRIMGQGNRVAGCYLGPDATGTAHVQSGPGLWIVEGKHNVIGGETAAEANVISGGGNTYSGLCIYNGAAYNQVKGNIIGLTATGSDTLCNSFGISLSRQAVGNEIGPGNVISGNRSGGVFLTDERTHDNHIFGNAIGTDLAGTQQWGNQGFGVWVIQGASGNVIGGADPSLRNLISGNLGGGIRFDSADTDSNRVMGNYIGTDGTGDGAIPNGENGVELANVGPNLIGGANPGEGNVISGNAWSGISIWGSASTGNWVLGNRIGVAASGDIPLGNGEHGVHLHSTASDNIIGPSNVVAYNGDAGVCVNNTGTAGNRITANSIYLNTNWGIFLSGGNDNMAAPVLTGLGSVYGTALPGALVELFTGPDAQGKTFVDSVRADAGGDFTFEETPVGPYITATATDSAGNTSSFSQALELTGVVLTEGTAPESFALWPNYPNPFNPETTVRFDVAALGRVTLGVYNVRGQRVATLTDRVYAPGRYQATLTAESLPSGMYFCRVEMGTYRAVIKMLLCK